MERKTAHRIFGILVIIALVIIALPLLLNKRAPTPVQVSANTPSFPGVQSSQKEDNNADAVAIDPDNESVTADKISETDETTTATTVNDHGLDTAVTTSSAVSAKGKAAIEKGNMVITPDSAAESNDVIQQMDAQTALPPTDKRLSVAQEGEAITFEPNGDTSMSHAVSEHSAPPSADDLKKNAWAVLVGSFKDKNNAKRVTDTLRTNGYKAFTAEAKNKGITRVYVGPEFKQIAAASLANKIEKNMKIHGIVVAYKPLEL